MEPLAQQNALLNGGLEGFVLLFEDLLLFWDIPNMLFVIFIKGKWWKMFFSFLKLCKSFMLCKLNHSMLFTRLSTRIVLWFLWYLRAIGDVGIHTVKLSCVGLAVETFHKTLTFKAFCSHCFCWYAPCPSAGGYRSYSKIKTAHMFQLLCVGPAR